MITVSGLTKKFQGTTVIDDISFEIKKGEIVGFLGPNGAGKTTTMRILTGFLSPTKGKICVGDLNLEKNPLKIREKIGYLPENNPLYADMKVFEALDFTSEAKGIKKHGRQYREIVKICGIEEVLGKTIHQLSKGYKQRVGLAQALFGNPDVLILDEPTTGLDPNQIQEIRQVIRNIGKTKTIIFSTHILQEVSALCDRALIVHKGKIVAQGTVDELTKNKKEEKIHITVQGADKEVLKKELLDIDPSLKIEDRQIDEEGVGYSIVSNLDRDIRKDIFQKAIRNNWMLLEMRKETQNLEDVFRQLTTNA